MKATDIVEQLKTRKGQHVQITWKRWAKTFKDCPHSILKKTTAFVRAGIEYANLAVVKEGVESGERGPVQPLKWGTWMQYPFIIEHKHQEYVRLYPAVFANLRPVVEWSINGRAVEYAEAKPYLLSSETRKREDDVLCFTICAEDIIAIGQPA